MKKLLQHAPPLFLMGSVLMVSSFDALAVTASVSVTATSAGNMASTRLGRIDDNGDGLCQGGPPGGCTGTAPTGTSCFNSSTDMFNTWNVSTFPIQAGTHTYKLNIADSADSKSLDKLLCGTAGGTTPPCNVCICILGGSETSTSNGNCTASSGQIIPTCAGGHVVSVTSNLTVNCP